MTSANFYLTSFVVLIITGVYMLAQNQPRGIRNNNPLNIRENQAVDYDWLGEHELDLDSEFEEFETPVHGIRAGARILRNYRDIHGLNTVSGIINRWAPTIENDTQSYIDSVSSKIGVSPNQLLDNEIYPELIAAMIYHENGAQPYSMEQINEGFVMGFA